MEISKIEGAVYFFEIVCLILLIAEIFFLPFFLKGVVAVLYIGSLSFFLHLFIGWKNYKIFLAVIGIIIALYFLNLFK